MPVFAQTESDSTNDCTQVPQGITMLGTYYADKFVGRHTSNGEIFRQNQYTAAHKTIAFGTYLLVAYPTTGRTVVVRVNDRCPKSNILDMTKIAIHALGIKGSGKVMVTTLDPTLGYMFWSNQDTLAMTTEEYLAYRDKSKRKRISPYPHATKDSEKTVPSTAKVIGESPKTKIDTKPTETTDTALPDNTEPPVWVNEKDSTVVEPTLKGPLYDLELCIVGSQYAAWLERKRLPEEMQSKLLLESNKRNREVRLILILADIRSHVVRTQAELIDLFPESCLIPHGK